VQGGDILPLIGDAEDDESVDTCPEFTGISPQRHRERKGKRGKKWI
jgi:hypothetical protein